MRVITRLFLILTVAALIFGCAAEKKPAGPAKAKIDYTEMAKKLGFELVEADFVKKIVGDGVFNASRGVIIDAMPAKKYDKKRIPTALNFFDVKFVKNPAPFIAELDKRKVTKDTLIVTYCGGLACEKSIHVAKKLRELGYKNVKIYLKGMPDWSKKYYVEVSHQTAKMYFDKGGAAFIDARPFKKFKKGTIPGSASMPDTKFDKWKFVIYCGGYACHKSHAVAEMLIKLGVPATKVQVFSGGLPEWKQNKYPMSAAQAAAAPKAAAPKTPFPSNADGTVDAAWFLANAKAGKLPANVAVIDVRTAKEVAQAKIQGSTNLDSNLLYKEGGCDKFIKGLPKADYYILHCASGGRAGETYDNLFLPKSEDGCDWKAGKGKVFFLDGSPAKAFN